MRDMIYSRLCVNVMLVWRMNLASGVMEIMVLCC